MSREIELKIPLTEESFSSLKNIILEKKMAGCLTFSKISHVIKSDEYYSLYESHDERVKNKELRVIRIRCERVEMLEPSGIDIFGDSSESIESAYFTIKEKSLENGIEFNREYETKIDNPDVLRSFFKAAGYKCWFKKIKDSFSTYSCLTDTNFEAHLELERVNDLPYIEIEYTGDDLDPGQVRENLEKILLALKIDPKNRDCRSWPQILGQY